MKGLKTAASTGLTMQIALSGQALAACDRNERIPAAHANCLSAKWRNPTELETLSKVSWYEVQNRCSGEGRVVSRADVRMRMDRTLHLDNGNRRSGEVRGKIRGAFCCADLSVFCSH